MDVRIQRVYEPAHADDGTRVLVDRLWPRGLAKQAAQLDLWAKDAAPSAELRKSWHADPDAHDPDHFEAFAEEYRAELGEEPALSAVRELAEIARTADRLTLLYAAKNEESNHALILRDVILEMLRDGAT